MTLKELSIAIPFILSCISVLTGLGWMTVMLWDISPALALTTGGLICIGVIAILNDIFG